MGQRHSFSDLFGYGEANKLPTQGYPYVQHTPHIPISQSPSAHVYTDRKFVRLYMYGPARHTREVSRLNVSRGAKIDVHRQRIVQLNVATKNTSTAMIERFLHNQ